MISRFFTMALLPISARQRDARDTQRARVYQMEREFVGGAVSCPTSRHVLQEIANHACKYYRVKPLRVVVFSNPSQRLFGELFAGQIRLNRAFHGAHITTLLHELAHYIADQIYEDIEDHGKQFAGVYMHLLDKYRVMPSCAFRALAKKRRIKIAGKFRPDVIGL